MLISIKVKTFAAATAFLAFASPLLAHSAAPTGSLLEQALSQRIADGMRPIHQMGTQQPQSGIARVVFQVGADGRTHGVRISKRSGSSMVDREAVRMVSTFHDLPEGDGRNVYAVLQYGNSGDGASAESEKALGEQVKLARLESSKNVMTASADTPKGVPLAALALASVPDRPR